MSIWQSSLLNEILWIAHGTATRDFGSTRYPNEGEEDATAENRARFLHALGLDPARLVVSGNEHGNRVETVSQLRPFEPSPLRTFSNCDGLISSDPGIVLGTKTADCLPLFFVDPMTRTIAVAHAGWKGVASGIAIETVRAFLERGARPQDLLVAIGPSIRPCHYKVSAERHDEMLTRTPFISADDFADGRVDLRAIAVRQMIASGILATNIDASAPCTACHPDQFFSYHLSRDMSQGTLSVISIHTRCVDMRKEV